LIKGRGRTEVKFGQGVKHAVLSACSSLAAREDHHAVSSAEMAVEARRLLIGWMTVVACGGFLKPFVSISLLALPRAVQADIDLTSILS
jgi:hypothetical protein